MKHYQVDLTVVARQKGKVGYDRKSYDIGVFVCASNPYNAAVEAYRQVNDDLRYVLAFSIHKIEEVEVCKEGDICCG